MDVFQGFIVAFLRHVVAGVDVEIVFQVTVALREYFLADLVVGIAVLAAQCVQDCLVDLIAKNDLLPVVNRHMVLQICHAVINLHQFLIMHQDCFHLRRIVVHLIATSVANCRQHF